MKGLVVYHSTAGSTKKIAQAIHAGMVKTGAECDLARIRDVTTDDLEKYNLIGVGSSVIRLREMPNVTAFIEYTMRNVDGKHGFAFCTHGALPGHYLSRVVPAMKQRGMAVIGWNDWFGTVYHPGCPKPYFTDGHPDETDLKEAADFGREMVERSKKISAGETGLVPALPQGHEYDEMYDPAPPPPREVFEAFGKVRDQMVFTVNKEKCLYPKCTHCIDSCPTNAIDFMADPPVFDINCFRCYICIQTCPRDAIEVDWEKFHEIHQLMVPPLEGALKVFQDRGKFRPLVPREDIGWDNYVWQMKNPVYKTD
ncbi:flavodoxin domain-containing protein [Chloroflexota bacterium]